MSKKLFVGSLSWDTTDETLRTAFASYGEIAEAKVITDRDTGRSRGFGFVTFEDEQDAERAKQELDGSMLDGRNIHVDEARERKPRTGGRDRY
ncbi:MAG: RNA-binding protein [Candidatus Coatesbacteria bacterium]|nr:RNA-binding protein [Candidatus Coatesbacteria bacterium]